MKGVKILNSTELFVKNVVSPVSTPLNKLRTELEGYWMLVTDVSETNGVEYAVVRHYGTDRDALLNLWEALSNDEPSAMMYCNKRINWMGGAFVAKVES